MESSHLIKKIETGKLSIHEITHENVNEIVCEVTGKTAIFYAVHFQRNDIVSRLFKMGASIYRKDKYNKTPLDYASHSTMVCIQEFLSQEVKSLIKENDSLNKQNMSKKRKLEEISDENEDLRKNDYERIKEKRKLEHTIVSKEEIIEQLKRENEKTEENLKDAQKAFKTLRNSIGSKK